MNIVLIGFMASGKTSVGRRVAKRLGFRFMDTDHVIETEQGCAISEIFERQGEPAFRAMETDLLRRARKLDCHVFATGGGIVTTPGNIERLKDAGVVVFLKADPEDILRRLENDKRRPKVQGGDLRAKVTTLLGERMPLYEQADIVIETIGKTPNQVAGEVLRLATGFRRPTPTVTLTDEAPARGASGTN
jgi:shikimate kinase